MGLITSLIGMKQQRDLHASEQKTRDKNAQTAQTFAIIQALDHARSRDDRLAEDYAVGVEKAIQAKTALTVASQQLKYAHETGDQADIARKQAEYDGLLSLTKFQDSVVGGLAGKRKQLNDNMDTLGQFLNKMSVVQDALGMREMIAQAQQPAGAAQAGGGGGGEPAAAPTAPAGAAPPSDFAGPTLPEMGVTPSQQQAGGGENPNRMQNILGIAKGISPSAELEEGGQGVTLTAETPSEAARMQKSVAQAEESRGQDLPVSIQTAEEKRGRETRKGMDSLAQASAPLQKVGIEMRADENGISFFSPMQSPTGEVVAGKPGILQNAPPEDVARAVETIAMQARANPQVALAAQRDLGPMLESYAANLANNGDLIPIQRAGQRPAFRVNLFSPNNTAARKFGEAVLALSNGGQSQNMPIFELPSAGQAVEQFMKHAREQDAFLTENANPMSEAAATVEGAVKGIPTMLKGLVDKDTKRPTVSARPTVQRGQLDAEKLVDYVAHFEEEGGKLSEDDSRAVLMALSSNIGFGVYRWGRSLDDLATIAHPKYAAKIRAALRQGK